MSSSSIENFQSHHSIASNPGTEPIAGDSSDPKPTKSASGIFREDRDSRPAIKRKHLKEFRASGISDEIARLNFRSVGQAEAFGMLTDAVPQVDLRINSGRLRSKWLRRFEQLSDGGWAVNGLDPDTNWETEMDWGRVKPDVPRRDWDRELGTFKDKFVKYESPTKTPNRVTYLRVDLATWERVARSYGLEMPHPVMAIDPQTGEVKGFWEWVRQHPQIDVVLTEGEKKAACLLSRGIVAIALPGIWCGTVRDGNTWQLHRDLLHLTQKRRNFYILFDYEPREKQARHIGKATVRLGKALESEGANARIPQLPGPDKGIDDWIVAQNVKQGAVEAASYHHQSVSLASLWVGTVKGFASPCRCVERAARDLLARAVPFKTYCRLLALPSAFSVLTYKPNLTVNERYIGHHLPPKGQRFVALKAPKGTGKTEWIARTLENHIHRFDGRRLLILSHRIQLGSTLCGRFSLPYLTEKSSFAERDIFGLGLCINSLHPHSKARFKPEDWEDCIVVIDEGEQVLWHMLNSTTCRRDRVEILSCFQQIIANASEVIVADADLSDHSIDYLKEMLDCDPWILENVYQSKETSFDATLYEGKNPSQLVLALIEAIARGERVLIHTSSQKHKSKWGTRTLEKMLAEKFPERKIVRIDSESVADKTHPAFGAVGKLNSLLLDYEIVIASPSIETGVSIDLREHFDSVWAIATGKQSVQSVSQAIARLREPVPRHIWAAARGERIGDGSINAKNLIENIRRLAKGHRHCLSATRGIKAATRNLKALYRGDFNGCDFDFQPRSVNCWAKQAARINAGSLCYREALVEMLEREGHRVGFADNCHQEAQPISKTVGQFRDVNYQQHCERVAEPSRYLADDAQFKDLASQIAMTEDERETVKHNQIARRYRVPVTSELVEKDDSGWHQKIQLHYFTEEGREFVEDAAWRSFTSQSQNGAVFDPDFARNRLWVQVKFWELLGLNALNSVSRVLSEGDPIAAPIAQKCRDCRRDIKLAFGVTIPEKASDIVVIQLMLKVRGQKLVYLARQRNAVGKALRVYSRPVADFFKDEKGKPIKDSQGQIVALSDGREAVFAAWTQHQLDLRQKAVERLEAERRVIAEETRQPVEIQEKPSPLAPHSSQDARSGDLTTGLSRAPSCEFQIC